MDTIFNEGDVLIYFNQSSSHIVLLDKIDEDYFNKQEKRYADFTSQLRMF